MMKQIKLTFSPLQFKLLFIGAVSSGVVIGLSIALLVISGGCSMTDKEVNTRITLAVVMVAIAGVLLIVLLGGKS